MNRAHRSAKGIAATLLCGILPGAIGCSHEAAAEIAALSGSYLGGVVATLATAGLHEYWGIESASAHDHAETDDHAHEAGALHDHEH